MVESCRVELRAEATGLQPAYPVPGLKLSKVYLEGFEPTNDTHFKCAAYSCSATSTKVARTGIEPAYTRVKT